MSSPPATARSQVRGQFLSQAKSYSLHLQGRKKIEYKLVIWQSVSRRGAIPSLCHTLMVLPAPIRPREDVQTPEDCARRAIQQGLEGIIQRYFDEAISKMAAVCEITSYIGKRIGVGNKVTGVCPLMLGVEGEQGPRDDLVLPLGDSPAPLVDDDLALIADVVVDDDIVDTSTDNTPYL
ncbi:hypothetical protein ARMGADRAFT_1039231 [Armillaria gallica]|uniref:Uncharacterized protein n=1 Tax=Armillaria gallica TaxID=47427 RepID=A0A2H3CJM0_ARMGA|nr:hypothetical protein ARMGADRAFT_1039231 [Armillaria gallica]